MTEKSKAVTRGFVRLSDAERKEVLEELGLQERSGSNFGDNIKRAGNELNAGAVRQDGCPCCGR